MPENNGGSGPVPKAAISRSVQTAPTDPWQTAGAAAEPLIFMMANAADEMTPWGGNVKGRDRQLRNFIPAESLFASALGVVISRNSAFSWKLEGPDEKVDHYHDVLAHANWGRGWVDLIAKTSIDLYTQDSGAFWEVVREADNPEAPVIGINHLDSARCWYTGVPQTPVIYLDQTNNYHLLKWYQAVHFVEMPATYEGKPGLQYCAMTRMLRAAKILRDISIYISEKVGGRHTRAITMLKGVTAKSVEEALLVAANKADASGLMRFSTPVMVSSVDPSADVGFQTLEISSLPDGFDLDLTNKQYIAQIAMAFLSDYQEFAPLPGGGLGTSTQSEILHLKNRGKGPGLFMKLISQALNFFVLPDQLEFMFDEQDMEQEKTEADVKKARAEERKLRLESTEISVPVAQMMALESGDLTQEQYDELQKEAKEAKEQAEAQAQAGAEAAAVTAAAEVSAQSQADDNADAAAQDDTGGTVTNEEDGRNIGRKKAAPYSDVPVVGPNRLAIEKEIADEIERAFAELKPEFKHASHDQSTHGHGGGGSANAQVGKAAVGQMNATGKTLLKDITPKEAQAISNYAQTEYEYINEMLRKGPGAIPRHLEQTMVDQALVIDAAVKKTPPLKEPIVVYRKVRGLDPNIEEFSDLAYTSTTMDKAVADNFGGDLIEITIPAGARALPVGYLRSAMADHDTPRSDYGEAEVLLPRRSSFRKTGDGKYEFVGLDTSPAPWKKALAVKGKAKDKFIWNADDIEVTKRAEKHGKHDQLTHGRGRRGADTGSGDREKKTPYDDDAVLDARAKAKAYMATHGETHLIPDDAPVEFMGRKMTRGEMREEIISDYVRDQTAGKAQEHKAYVIMGPPAAGKSSMADPLAENEKAAVVDSDHIKARLPEFANGAGASVVHEESSAMAAEARERIAKQGYNMVIPVVGKSEMSVLGTAGEVSNDGYEVHLKLVHADREVTAQRVVNRFKKGEEFVQQDGSVVQGNRFVDPDYAYNVVQNKPLDVFKGLRDRNDSTFASYEGVDNTGGRGNVQPV